MWNLTVFIIPGLALLAAVGVGLVVRHIFKRIKQNASQRAAAHQPTEELVSEQILGMSQEAALEIQPEAEETFEPQTQDLSDADFLRRLQTIRYDATDNDIVLEDKESYLKWLTAQKTLSTASASEEDRTKANQALDALNQHFMTNYGHTPSLFPSVDFCASITDENGDIIKDNRVFCRDGNGAERFKAACEKEYAPKEGDAQPTIFQVNAENRQPFVVFATMKDTFYAGVDDIKESLQKQQIKDFTAYLITDYNKRQLIEQKCQSIEEIDEFLNSNLQQEQEAEEELGLEL